MGTMNETTTEDIIATIQAGRIDKDSFHAAVEYLSRCGAKGGWADAAAKIIIESNLAYDEARRRSWIDSMADSGI